MWIRQPAPVLFDDQHTCTSSKWRSAVFRVPYSMTIDDCFSMFGAGCISSVWRLLSKWSNDPKPSDGNDFAVETSTYRH